MGTYLLVYEVLTTLALLGFSEVLLRHSLRLEEGGQLPLTGVVLMALLSLVYTGVGVLIFYYFQWLATLELETLASD